MQQLHDMCREELLQALRRRDLALYAGGLGLVVVAHSGAAGRLIRSDRFRQALDRERRFVEMWLADDDAAICSDPGGHERHYRAAVDDLGEEYTCCLICGGQRLIQASQPVPLDMTSYRRRQLGKAV